MDDNSSTVQSTAPVTAPAATFTQDDVDRIVRGRVNEVNAKVNDLTQQLVTANAKISDMAASLVKYQQSAFLTSIGVPTELQDFVAFEANKQVSGDVTFEQAAQNFVKDKGSLYGIGVSSNGNGDGQGQNATSEQGTENTNPETSGQQNTEDKNNSASSGQQSTEDKNNSASSDKSGTENKSSNKPDSKNNAQGNKVSTATNASGEGNTDTSTDLDAAVQAYLKQHHLG